jgi:hypothetical protein
LQFELWIGDAAEIRAKRVRKQKTDRQDAQLLLRLMMEGRFPRIWVPDAANRDLGQLLWHRHRLVQMRTRVMNQLHVVALNEGLRRKKALWRPAGRNELESLKLAPWASRRRQDLLDIESRRHSFAWDAATGMTDLMGPSNGFARYAHAVNDLGEFAGVVQSSIPKSSLRRLDDVWRHRRKSCGRASTNDAQPYRRNGDRPTDNN